MTAPKPDLPLVARWEVRTDDGNPPARYMTLAFAFQVQSVLLNVGVGSTLWFDDPKRGLLIHPAERPTT